ncbi:MAG: hypothetical protein KF889_17340 [Alphaproteobacteria bacterium]|nr:hypothetical protein [Alphaproteobacteria bacterium]MCW5739865.1 hypothetical protein [Alphaproteobacteria bacterium]
MKVFVGVLALSLCAGSQAGLALEDCVNVEPWRKRPVNCQGSGFDDLSRDLEAMQANMKGSGNDLRLRTPPSNARCIFMNGRKARVAPCGEPLSPSEAKILLDY